MSPRAARLMAWLAAALLLAIAGNRKTEARAAMEAIVHWNVTVGLDTTFSPTKWECMPGQHVEIRLVNTASAKQSEVAHSLVVLQLGADADRFGVEAVTALPEDNYIPAGFRTMVIFDSGLVRPGESKEFRFTAPTKRGSYPVVCSFPGHCLLGMRGEILVK